MPEQPQGKGRSLTRSFVALILALCAAGHVAAAEPLAATGRIAGKVIVGPHLAGQRMQFNLYPRSTKELAAAAPEQASEVGNVVVYIEKAPVSHGGAPTVKPRVAQRQFSFEPHVLAVVRGTTVEFPNRDTVFHNVFSLSKVAAFDLGRYPSGESKSVRFDEPGVVKVYCHIHSDMSALIVVLDNPYFAKPGADGRFAIEGVPPGDYRVAAWHERARLSVARVQVQADSTAAVDFEIPLTVEPDGG